MEKGSESLVSIGEAVKGSDLVINVGGGSTSVQNATRDKELQAREPQDRETSKDPVDEISASLERDVQVDDPNGDTKEEKGVDQDKASLSPFARSDERHEGEKTKDPKELRQPHGGRTQSRVGDPGMDRHTPWHEDLQDSEVELEER